MPRPKPSFSNYSYLFESLEIVVPEPYVINSYITIKCKNNLEHSYKMNVPEILKGKDPKECPHCKIEKKYVEKGVSINFFDNFIKKNNLEIVNKKDFYSRWEDSIKFRCTICKEYEFEIKAIGYFEKHIEDKKYCCERCIKIDKGIIEEKEFNKKLENIKFEVVKKELLAPMNYDSLPEGLRNNLKKQNKWILLNFESYRKKVRYQCTDCGEIKYTSPSNIFHGRGFGCSNCDKIKKRKELYERIKQACESSNCYPIKEKDFYKSSHEIMEFKCNNCGEVFEYPWYYVSGNARNENGLKIICKNCYRSTKRAAENNLLQVIKSLYTGQIIPNDRETIAPLELDIYFPDKKLAIEYCGGIWHSTKFSENIYRHRDKYEKCKENGIRLLTIFEDEWKYKNEICLSRIKNVLGMIDSKIFARKCVIQKISNSIALEFCNKNHIQGKGQVNEAYGLLYNNELVSVMTFSKPSVSKSGKEYDWELNRFCSIIDTIVIGGANKLLSEFLKNHKNEKLVTFCDLRWGTGNVYEKMGFRMIDKTRPNYYYIGTHTKWKRRHRFNYTKQRLIQLFKETDQTLTEEMIAKKNGLYRIFDCGHLKFQIG